MAIDTIAKRSTMMDFGDEMSPGLPIPDGTMDVMDRYHLLWIYYIELITHLNRIYIVPASSRTYALALESRAWIVPDDDRIVEAE